MRLTHSIHRGIQQYPEAAATIDGDRMRTWRESANRISRLAAALRALGLSAGDRVAIWALNSDIYHECLLAIAWADGVFVPLNTRWSLPEIGFALQDCDARILLVDDFLVDAAEKAKAEGHFSGAVVFMGPGPAPQGTVSAEALIGESLPVPDAGREGKDLAGIYYTGGTTGRPKGVMLSHENLISSALAACATGAWIPPGARYLHAAPMFHVADASGWMSVNALGGTHVFVPRFSPATVARAIEQYRITDTILVPTMIRMLVDSPEAADADLSSLRRLLYGGSPMPLGLLRRAMDRLPGVAFAQSYAMTEMSPLMTLLTDADHHVEGLQGSGGRALPHVDVRIADQQGNDVPAGVAGEILARGNGQMLGYWNRPEETAAALRDGWMHTGDIGYLNSDGYLFVVDRSKDMIITGGENVYSTEVENALETHPAVGACAVIGLPDQAWGERVHAVVVLTDGASATVDELKSHARALIAGYKVPRTIDFSSSLPLSGPGKVLKRQLRDEYAAGGGSSRLRSAP